MLEATDSTRPVLIKPAFMDAALAVELPTAWVEHDGNAAPEPSHFNYATYVDFGSIRGGHMDRCFRITESGRECECH